MEFFKEMFSKRRLKVLLFSVIFGLLIMFLFSGKSHINLEAIAVSPDEQYIACFETGNGRKIRCFRADGSLAFDYEISADISAGGNCTLWFEEDVLCVLFYRTEKIAHFAMDGTIQEIVDNTSKETPPEYPSFSQKERKYIFDGNEIDVVYNKRTFLGYWLFGAERYLAITLTNGETKIVYAWTAAEGIIEKAS